VIYGEPPVGAGNRHQFAEWNGSEGEQWAANARFYDGSVRLIHNALMAAAQVGAEDRVLDVGCGTGQCTRDAARQASHGSALGIDLSRPLIVAAEAARRLDGPANAAFVWADAEVYPFRTGEFDIALSRFGTMFFGDQISAFANIARGLRPSGRIAFVSWRAPAENEWLANVTDALTPGAAPARPTRSEPGAFRHADPEDIRAILGGTGFTSITIEPLDVPMVFGPTADDSFDAMVPVFGWMVQHLDAESAALAFERMRAALRAHETDVGVALGSASWLVTAVGPSNESRCNDREDLM